MARIVKPLTVMEIDASDPKEKEYTLFDGDGLMLVIKPAGTKTWIYRFKSPVYGKDKKVTIGQYLPKNKGVSLKEAREERDRLRAQLKEGTLPAGKNKLKSIEKKQIDGENDKQITKILDDFLEYHGNIMTPFFKTSKSSFLIPPLYDTSGNSFTPFETRLLSA